MEDYINFYSGKNISTPLIVLAIKVGTAGIKGIALQEELDL